MTDMGRYDHYTDSFIQEPCEDAISRQAVLKPYEGLKDDDVIAVWLIRKNIEQQKNVNPQEPKTDIIDKIRTEIEKLPTVKCTETHRIYIDADDFKENVLAILDKYKAKSEET